MVKYVIIPCNGLPYALPVHGDETTYRVKEQYRNSVELLTVKVSHVDRHWAPNGVIRVEGHIQNSGGLTKRFIAYYRVNSTEDVLGNLEVQDF